MGGVKQFGRDRTYRVTAEQTVAGSSHHDRERIQSVHFVEQALSERLVEAQVYFHLDVLGHRRFRLGEPVVCTRGEDVVVAGFRGNLGGQCPIRWEDHADVELRAETARELGPEDQPRLYRWVWRGIRR